MNQAERTMTQPNAQQSNFASLGWGLVLGASLGGYLGYKAGQSEEFRTKMGEYREEWGTRASAWYAQQSTTWAKRYQTWSEKNSGIVEA